MKEKTKIRSFSMYQSDFDTLHDTAEMLGIKNSQLLRKLMGMIRDGFITFEEAESIEETETDPPAPPMEPQEPATPWPVHSRNPEACAICADGCTCISDADDF